MSIFKDIAQMNPLWLILIVFSLFGGWLASGEDSRSDKAPKK